MKRSGKYGFVIIGYDDIRNNVPLVLESFKASTKRAARNRLVYQRKQLPLKATIDGQNYFFRPNHLELYLAVPMGRLDN